MKSLLILAIIVATFSITIGKYCDFDWQCDNPAGEHCYHHVCYNPGHRLLKGCSCKDPDCGCPLGEICEDDGTCSEPPTTCTPCIDGKCLPEGSICSNGCCSPNKKINH